MKRGILLAHSGHGHVDMAAYDAYPEAEIKEGLERLPRVG